MRKSITIFGAIALCFALTSAAQALTSESATTEWRRYLAETYGFTLDSGGYAKCGYLRTDANDEPVADCQAEFKIDNTWRYIAGTVYSIVKAGERYDIDESYKSKWQRHWHKCGRRNRYAPGPLSSNGVCDRLMAGDLEYSFTIGGKRERFAFVHGTGTGAYPAIFKFRCRWHGTRATCTNKLGDSFRYTSGTSR